jgi:hypothetical protein
MSPYVGCIIKLGQIRHTLGYKRVYKNYCDSPIGSPGHRKAKIRYERFIWRTFKMKLSEFHDAIMLFHTEID